MKHLCAIGLILLFSCSQRPNVNPPWYPSIDAFEHHDSARTHLFPEAAFGGDWVGRNSVTAVSSPAASYPSGWNAVYLGANDIFVYGGGDGNEASSIGAYAAKVDPSTLAPVWSKQLIDTTQNGEWDYPGTSALLHDGMLYVIYGYRLSKLDPQTGAITTLTLPTGDALPANTAYNGFSATSDGIIVGKSIYREAGCTLQGPPALLNCSNPSDVPSSVLVTIDPKTMTKLDTVTLPGLVIGRVTVGRYKGKEYVYLFAQGGFIRYAIGAKGNLTLDSSWATGSLLTSGQTSAWAVAVMGDWVLAQCNGLPASAPLSVYAVNQGDASNRFTIQPFASDPIPPLVKAAYRTQGPGGTQAVSFIPSMLSADPETNMVYVMDALPGKIAGLRVTSSGFQTVWTASQVTTEWVTIIGPKHHRAIVTTSLPGEEIPGINKHDEVVWRDAATGRELARSDRLPEMTPATMVQPSYDGSVIYPGLQGTLYRLTPAAKR